jgi:surface antigen
MRASVSLATLVLCLSTSAGAVNWNFLEYSPVSQFTEKDFELLRQTAQAALEQAPDGDTRGWRNPDSGAFGTVQPLDTYPAQGTTCRRVEMFNSAGGASGTSRFKFCRQEDGTWKVAPREPERPPAAATD